MPLQIIRNDITKMRVDAIVNADQTDTLITSANLSYHGQEGNIELGARIHSKELAKQVEDIFTSL